MLLCLHRWIKAGDSASVLQALADLQKRIEKRERGPPVAPVDLRRLGTPRRSYIGHLPPRDGGIQAIMEPHAS